MLQADNNKKILVTGATGYIGSRLVRRLCESGHSVRAMVIDNDPLLYRLEGIKCEIIKGDITDAKTLRPCLEGIRTVFHLAAVLIAHNKKLFHKINYEGTKNLIGAAVEARVGHFIYISAAATAYKEKTTYGESKLKSETLLKSQENMSFTIIRPTLLYGAEGSQEFKLYVENLRKFPVIVPVVGMGRARKRPVWLDDIVTGLALTVDKPVTHGKLYNFSGGTDISMWDFTKLICSTFGIKKPLIGIPVWLCNVIATIASLFTRKPPLNKDTILGVTMDANFSSEEARRDIGYNPIGIEEGFRRAFADRK